MSDRYPFHVDPRDAASQLDELAVQVQFRKLMRNLAPKVLLVGIPNAGRRTAWERRQRSAEGLVPGFPDMAALFDGRTALLEFKSGKGSLSNEQIDVLNKLVRLDFPVGVFRHAETAVEWLSDIMPHAFVGRIAA